MPGGTLWLLELKNCVLSSLGIDFGFSGFDFSLEIETVVGVELLGPFLEGRVEFSLQFRDGEDFADIVQTVIVRRVDEGDGSHFQEGLIFLIPTFLGFGLILLLAFGFIVDLKIKACLLEEVKKEDISFALVFERQLQKGALIRVNFEFLEQSHHESLIL